MAHAKLIAESHCDLSAWSTRYDCLIIIADHFTSLPDSALQADVLSLQAIDLRVGKELVVSHNARVPGQRLLLAATGPLNRDFDDVRRFSDAANNALKQAVAIGAVKPLLWVIAPSQSPFAHAAAAAYLGAAQALWQPLEAREHFGETVEPVQQVALYSEQTVDVTWLDAVEQGRRVARDICGTEPERMSPPNMAVYLQHAFADSNVSVAVTDDVALLKQQYPLLSAVARSSFAVARHQPRVVRLEYVGAGEISQTLMFVGKGLSYDTGGADLKIGGAMAGMSRDKGGAAAVAGFMKTVSLLAPKGIKVVAEIGAVRNSIGSDCFVTDEVIKGHSGVRVRIGNTDAEGRLVMVDLLSKLREEAVSAVNPTLFTIATLTGHAARAWGPYTALVENGVAADQQLASQLCAAGDAFGDGCEVSRVRKEDYDFVRPRTKADDILSSNTAPSSVTARGHQFPMAFLDIASRLTEHNRVSEQPLPFVHIDIAGSGVEGSDWAHGKPSAAPVVALAARYLLG